MKNRSKFKIIMATITYICTVLAYILESRKVQEYEKWDYEDEE